MSGYSIVKQVADEWSLPSEAIVNTNDYKLAVDCARREAANKLRDSGMEWGQVAEVLGILPGRPKAHRAACAASIANYEGQSKK